jgi:hypothetical protein
MGDGKKESIRSMDGFPLDSRDDDDSIDIMQKSIMALILDVVWITGR